MSDETSPEELELLNELTAKKQREDEVSSYVQTRYEQAMNRLFEGVSRDIDRGAYELDEAQVALSDIDDNLADAFDEWMGLE